MLATIPQIDDRAREALDLPLSEWSALASSLSAEDSDRLAETLLLLSARAERLAVFLYAFAEIAGDD
jgi:hypothetical protein